MTQDLLDACKTAFSGQRWKEVELLAEAALGRACDEMTLVNIGIVARDSQLFEIADRIFLALNKANPDFLFAYYELGFSLILQGKHAEAVELLRAYLKMHPEDHRTTVLNVKALYLLGQKHEAEEHIRSLPLTGETLQLQILKDLGDFLERFPKEHMRGLVHKVLERSPFLSRDQVQNHVLSAKAERRPFSLIRLGDGEGAFLRLDRLDELTFPALYRDNRAQFISYWFGSGFSQEDAFDATVRHLGSAIDEADVVGLRMPGWLDHEYKIGSPRGISTLVNIYRYVERLQMRDKSLSSCSQSIHIDLGMSDFFAKLLGGEDRIGLISCFSQLPAILGKAFNVKHVDFYKLPGEQHFKDIIGVDATEGEHFPTAYDKTMAALRRPLAGSIFLVAGGILGKLYVQQIKRSGGIALDIGSLADAWVKKVTRPGYEALSDLAL